MPQTLLALLAIASAALFTLGQKQASNETMGSIVQDEFELSVAGTLLNAVEFADSRAFDEATTPDRLRSRLGLPVAVTQAVLDTLTVNSLRIPVSSLATKAKFGLSAAGVRVACNINRPSLTPLCNDLSDLDGGGWQDVTITTPNGSPLPIEVKVEVNYVTAGNPDVVSSTPTFHKRVDVWARSPSLLRMYPQHQVMMRRVISYDPAVALEYLKRSTSTASASNAALIAQLTAALATAQANAATALANYNAAVAALATAQANATAKATAATAANAAATLANTTAAASAAQVTQAQANVTYYQGLYNNSTNSLYRWYIETYYLDPARDALTAAQAQARADASAATAAQSAANAANAAVTTANAAVTTAQQNVSTTQAALASANAAVTSAQAALNAATSGTTTTTGTTRP